MDKAFSHWRGGEASRSRRFVSQDPGPDLGGAAIVLGFAWTWIKDHDTIELTRIQTSNQQFGEAATLISGKSVDGRAAAIYSLGNLMQTRPEYITPVINILNP